MCSQLRAGPSTGRHRRLEIDLGGQLPPKCLVERIFDDDTIDSEGKKPRAGPPPRYGERALREDDGSQTRSRGDRRPSVQEVHPAG